jgi:hypothetical protein
MAGWRVRPNTLVSRSSPERCAPIWSSKWDEIDTTMARPRVLDRAEIPVDAAQVAGLLIGKMLVRVLAEGVAGGRIIETEPYGIGGPTGHASWYYRTAAQNVAMRSAAGSSALIAILCRQCRLTSAAGRSVDWPSSRMKNPLRTTSGWPDHRLRATGRRMR